MLFGHAQLDGRGRPTEDRIAIRKLTDSCDLFAVFDGHSGSAVARLTVELLPKRIQAALEAAGTTPLENPAEMVALLKRCFIEHDKELAQNISRIRDSGSTASVGIVTPTHVYLAYAGDSPAFIMNPMTGLITAEAGKHEPTLASEAERIKAAGGTVEIDEYGTPRVDGALMVSRAFGDFSLKFDTAKPPPFETTDWSRMKVTAAADVNVWPRPPVGVLAIMSDGLVETNTSTLKPLAAVARDIQLALKQNSFNLSAATGALLKRHVANSIGTRAGEYDGDDLSMILVDVGISPQQTAGGAPAAATAASQQQALAQAAAAAAGKPKTRKAKHGRRNKTGKKMRLVKIFTV